MPFQKGNKLGTHNNHKSNFKPEIFVGTKWMQRNGMVERVPEKDVATYLVEGWILGRLPVSEETRRKQSEAGKRANNPAQWKPGHKTWNNGDKMPESACVAMSVGKLSRYGVTKEQVLAARAANMSWCSHHLRFEPSTAFTILHNGRRATRCQECHNKYTPWYKERYTSQHGLCAICGEIEPRLDAMSVDHKHDCPNPKHTRKHEPMIGCECSRGLLCSLCNPRLGYFEGFILNAHADIKFAEGTWESKALAYLAQYS